MAIKTAYIFGEKLMPDKEADAFFTHLNGELVKSTVCDTSFVGEVRGGGGFHAHIMTAKNFSEVEDKRSEILGSQIPVLIMKGQCGNQKWGFAQEYLELFPNHILKIIKGAGHAIYEEQPERYIEIISTFLR